LLLQHTEVGCFFGPDECLELLVADFVVIEGSGDFLGDSIIMSGVLEVLTECSYEDVCSVFPEDCGECVGPVDEAVRARNCTRFLSVLIMCTM